MSKKTYLILILVALLLIGIILQKQILTHFKNVLFISEQFPQIPIKPLGLVTTTPEHKKVEFETSNGKVIADLFVPKSSGKNPSLIIAMGIKTADKDKPLLLKFADTMARLGFVTFWPRLKVLDEGTSLPEEPETFVEAFKYVGDLPQTNPQRISFTGFSVGSSVALKAAADPQIANKVYGFVFFGGYFDVFDYYASLASQTFKLDGQVLSWKSAPDAVDHAKGLLESGQLWQMRKIFEATSSAQVDDFLNQVPQDEKDRLNRFNPRANLADFKAQIFILHDKSDTYVPYTESVRLFKDLPQEQVAAYHISDLFEHVQPNRPINLGELIKLYGFLYEVFRTLRH